MNWHEMLGKIKKEVPVEERRRIADEVAEDMGYDGVLDFIQKVVVESEEEEPTLEDWTNGEYPRWD